MGFWSAVCSIGSSIARGVGSVVGGAVKALSGGGLGLISGIASWVKENILGLEEAPSYDPREATVDETKKVNELLEKCIKSYSKEAEEYDELAKAIIEDQCLLLSQKLVEINEISGKKIIDDYIFKAFEINLNHIKKDLDRIYSKQITNVFSLNNNNLLDILRLDKGKAKQDKLRELAVNTITKANDILVEELSKFIKEQQSFISIKLEEYMENIKNDSIAARNATEQILKSTQEDRKYRLNLEKNYKTLINKLNLLDEVLLEERC